MEKELSAVHCISTNAKGLETGESYYIDENNTCSTRDNVVYVDVYNVNREWLGMAPRRAFAVLKTEQQAKNILADLKGMYPDMETLYEDVIVSAIGQEALYALRQHHLIETCGNFDGRKLYAI